MIKKIIHIRNFISRSFYIYLLRPVFFRMKPEFLHEKVIAISEFFGKYRLFRELTKLLFFYCNQKLEQTILGIHFSNPIGLAAGFDKDARLTEIFPFMGAGFMEVGSITYKPYAGNLGTRELHLVKSRAVLVNYGLKNDGAKIIASRLRGRKFLIPIGISVAKTNSKDTVDTKAGINDYTKTHNIFADIGLYTTLNISCPNAYGGEPFSDSEKLDKLLDKIDAVKTNKPLFIKISADTSEEELDKIIQVTDKHNVSGFICTNLTKDRSNDKIKEDDVPSEGGISGKVVEELSNNLIRYIYQQTGGRYTIIGLGGVFTAEDAYKKIKLGASLVQMVTGIFFQGPQVISEINQGLVEFLERDGYKNISEAIGKENSLSVKK